MMQAIFCRFQIVGVHFHPSATDVFERSRHRHAFHFEVVLNAAGLDNDDELTPVRFRQFCVDQFGSSTSVFDFDDQQAIGIAQWLGKVITEKFDGRGVRVAVSEDGENGAVVTYGLESVYDEEDSTSG